MTSQPASQQAIWQNVNLTQSQILGEGQVNILLDGQSASQLQLASQQTIWQNVNLTLILILRGCPSFTSIHTWHFGRWPGSQLQLASQPAIWQNAKLILIQILRGCPSFTSIHKWHFSNDQPTSQSAAIGQPSNHQTKCQPDPKSNLGDSSSAMPCHFTHYIFQAFSDKKYLKKYWY